MLARFFEWLFSLLFGKEEENDSYLPKDSLSGREDEGGEEPEEERPDASDPPEEGEKRAVFLAAGHWNKDSGAIGHGGVKESDLTKELRDMIFGHLPFAWRDDDGMSLSLVVREIKKRSQPGDIICDLHFNAYNGKATGVEVIVPAVPSMAEMGLAENITESISSTLRIVNRGVKTEKESHRGRLAMMRPEGINILVEVCFIDNPSDLESYQKKKEEVAKVIASNLKA